MKDFRGGGSEYARQADFGDPPAEPDYSYPYGVGGAYPFGGGFYPPPPPWAGWWVFGYPHPSDEYMEMMRQQEKRFLEYRLEMLRREIEAIERRLKEINSQ